MQLHRARFFAAQREFVRKLKAFTRIKLVLKGIQTGEDAVLCCESGVDGIMVSNGGRAKETGRATIACLPEVLDGVAGRIPVLVDGGIRRSTDIFKALAMGARAVGVGRPGARYFDRGTRPAAVRRALAGRDQALRGVT